MTIGEKFCVSALNFSSSRDSIKDISIGKEGRIKFKVPFQVLFKHDQDLKKTFSSDFDFESLENFYIDIAGCLLVRKHLNIFIKFINQMDEQDYNEKLILYNHLHFSVQRVEEFLEWTFHVSFLHDVILGTFVANMEK